jgi:hypothetical protein
VVVDREADDLAAVGSRRQVLIGVGQRGNVEKLRERLTSFDLDQQDAASTVGQCHRQGRCCCGLAGAALAGHDMQPRLTRDSRGKVDRTRRGSHEVSVGQLMGAGRVSQRGRAA